MIRNMKKNERIGKMLELVMHSIFLVLGLITVGCVLLITVYLSYRVYRQYAG